MKKIFAAMLVTVLCSVFALSQTDNLETANWQTFAPADKDFSVEVPVELKGSGLLDDKSVASYRNVFDGTYFFIFTDNPKTPLSYTGAMEFVKTYRQPGSPESFGDFEIEKFVFTDKDDFHHIVLTAKGKNRIYVFQTVSPSKNDSAAERFFASLKLDENLVPNISVANSEDADKIKENPKNEKTVANNGETVPADIKVSPKTSQTTPLKIISKPRANYTDFARSYQISGKIVLRVAFSANGTIGEVTVLTKLPFGLTAQAIEAAKGIRFEPAMKEGVPYSVTKPVEYSFTIY